MTRYSYTPAADEIVRQVPVDAPSVSVVMAVRDGDRFLEKAVRSILSQSLRNYELIIVDDGSEDRTSEILDRFGDTRLKIVTQPGRGLAAALNRGVSLARASLVARMDADDVAMPARLEKQLNFMEANPEVGLLGTATTLIDEEGNVLGNWSAPDSDRRIKKALIRANQFAHPTVMFRKTLFEAAGGYTDMPFAQDYDLWLRMASLCKMANLVEPLLLRRETAEQFGSRRESRQIRGAMRARIGAVRRGDYSPLAARHLIKPAVASLMPGHVRQFARRVTGQRVA